MKLQSPELIRSTLHGGSAIGKDMRWNFILDSQSIAPGHAILKQMYPDESVNLIRALIAQGARLPGDFFLNPDRKQVCNVLRYWI